MKWLALFTKSCGNSCSHWRTYRTNMRLVKQDNSMAALIVLHILRALQMLVAIIVMAVTALVRESPWACLGIFISLLVTYSMFYITLAEVVFALYKMSKFRE